MHPPRQETRRAYRELFYTADLGGPISGAILYKETLYQSASDGRPFVECLTSQGILPGIKVDEVRLSVSVSVPLVTGTGGGSAHYSLMTNASRNWPLRRG